MKCFELHRDTDETGVSGIGVVAEGVEFSDGTCTMRWRTETASTVIYESIAHVEAIHGHGGLTRVVWTEVPSVISPAESSEYVSIPWPPSDELVEQVALALPGAWGSEACINIARAALDAIAGERR